MQNCPFCGSVGDAHIGPGKRIDESYILDLGCGKALSSIFLAKEFDAQVWAKDLWIEADDNLARIAAAGLEEKIFPIHGDARALPWARGFFDAIICVDAYIYFGTDDLYLKYLHQFVKPGWRQWYQARLDAGHGGRNTASDIKVLTEDGGRYMGIVRIIGRRKYQPGVPGDA